ncbi:MAG: HAD-IIB family hydrolase [Anaerovoracaceae bacterium]|jgi:HAD superfamily hydrolase (TIGR01484 family)
MIAMASDFDGTLYFMAKEEKYRPGDPEKIAEFQANGGLFGVCTGRSLRGILDTSESGRVDFDFYILASGALIMDRDFNTLCKVCIPRDLMTEIHEKYRNEVEIVIHANDTVYNFRDTYSLQECISSMDEIEGDSIYGLSFGTRSHEEASRIADEINSDYGETVTARVNVRNVDMVSKDCSKGSAVEFIKSEYGIDLMGGAGDSYNDLPLLVAADESFTFPYAPREVQDHADHVVSSIAESLHILSKI